jgi:hypothetical protein
MHVLLSLRLKEWVGRRGNMGVDVLPVLVVEK